MEAEVREILEATVAPEGRVKLGSLLAGIGRSAKLTNEELLQFKKLLTDDVTIKANNLKVIFIPFYMGMFMENGHSNRKKAMEWWEKEYSVLKSDPKAVRSFMMNNPRTLQDILDLEVSDYWEADVKEKIFFRGRTIVQESPVIQKCTINELGGRIETTPRNDGYLQILEHPKPHVKYWLGIDGTASDKLTGSEEGSKFAGTIIKGYEGPGCRNFVPVAQYALRPEKLEDSYRSLLYLARYYWAKTHPESNAGQAAAVVAFWINHGFEELLLNTQKYVGVNQRKLGAKYGTYRTVQILQQQIGLGNRYLRKKVEDIEIPSLLGEIATAGTGNKDELSSFLTALSAMGDIWDKPIKAAVKPKRLEYRFNQQTKRGEWIELEC